MQVGLVVLDEDPADVLKIVRLFTFAPRAGIWFRLRRKNQVGWVYH